MSAKNSGVNVLWWGRDARNGVTISLCKGERGYFITVSQRTKDERRRLALVPIDADFALAVRDILKDLERKFGIKLLEGGGRGL